MASLCFVVCVSAPTDQNVIVYDLCAFQPLHQLIHGSLPYFWSKVDAKCHPHPTVPTERRVETR